MKDKTAALLIIIVFIISFIVGYFIFDKMIYEMDSYYEKYGKYPDLISNSPPVMTNLLIVTLIVVGCAIVLCIISLIIGNGFFKEE
jgi:uncharacterized membrane protein